MLRKFIVISILSLIPLISSATFVARMEMICVEPQKKEVIRTIFLTDDNSVLTADPLGELLIADEVKQPSQESVEIVSKSSNGSESLLIHSTGEGELNITNPQGTVKFGMKCLTRNKNTPSKIFNLKPN